MTTPFLSNPTSVGTTGVRGLHGQTRSLSRVSEANRAVQQLDLTQCMGRLMSPRGLNWDKAKAEVAEFQYRRFLMMAVAHPDQKLVPSMLIDEVWHQHVLDTAQYMRDCDRIFGRYFHHDPYFGSRSTDQTLLARTFDGTCAIYLEMFGEDLKHSVDYADGKIAATSCGQGIN